MMDKIIIKGLKVFAHHGVGDSERSVGQAFVFNLILDVDVSAACATDDYQQTVCYADVVTLVTAVAKQNHFILIETLAAQITQHLFKHFDRVMAIEVEVQKPQAPIEADFDYVAVCIKRSR